MDLITCKKMLEELQVSKNAIVVTFVDALNWLIQRVEELDKMLGESLEISRKRDNQIVSLRQRVEELESALQKKNEALKVQAELWALASGDLAQAARANCQVPFHELHEPIKKIGEAIKL